MNLEFYPKEKLKEDLKKIVGKYLDVNMYTLFFFGSRITGANSDRSDIDVGIEGPAPIALEVLVNIKEEVLALPILYKIDIIDFKSVDQDFYKVAKQNVELIK